MNENNSNDHLQSFLGALSRLVKRQTSKITKRAIVMFGRKILGSSIKFILIKTAPIWGAVLIFLYLGYVAFSLIYAMPKMVAEDSTASAEERVAAFFGFSEEDAKGYEDIFETYKEVAGRWDDGLDESQKEQVTLYEFSWAILAGVDRMRNDPYIKNQQSSEVIQIGNVEIGVDGTVPPTKFIDLYKNAESKFGVDWEILASIHKNESTYSTFPIGKVSSAGAQGPMQFLPSTFSSYGVDGNGDGKKDIWNDADAIFSAANYLSKSGYKSDVRKAIWHYNHAEWYINAILKDAEVIHQITEKNVEVIEASSTENQETKKDEKIVYKFLNLATAPNLITPKPEETFEALRPKFKWKDSTITTIWEETECSSDENGQESCETVKKSKVEKIKLLVQADTYEGTYKHKYKWQTIITGGKEIKREMNAGVIVPSQNEYMKPFNEYLKENGIVKKIDVDTTMELIALYDEYYVEHQTQRNSLNYNEYPNLEHLQGLNGWLWPTVSKRITSNFGPRPSPCSGCSSFHQAVDIGAVQPGVSGDPVFAMADGVVKVSTYHSSAGNYINIDHGDGVVSRYLHLSRSMVSVGKKVKKGDVIGVMGETGSGTGVHLDFRILINGNYYDPLYYFK